MTETEDRIPVTTVTRTLLDLASVLDDFALAQALEVAEHEQLRSPVSLPILMDRHRGARGVGRLRRVLASEGYGMGVTNRELEELFVTFIENFALPRPELNRWLPLKGGGLRPDCLWRSQRVIVELQSFKHHGSRGALTKDAGRFRRLTLAGFTGVAVTWRQLTDPRERRALACDLRQLLGSR